MGLQRPPVTSLTAPEWEFFPLSLSYMFVPRVTKESILLLHIFEKMFMPHDRRADPPTGVCGRGCGRSWQACPSPGHPLLLAPAAPSLAVTLSTVTGGDSSAAGNGLGVSCVCVCEAYAWRHCGSGCGPSHWAPIAQNQPCARCPGRAGGS